MLVRGQKGGGAAHAARGWQRLTTTVKANRQPGGTVDMPVQHLLKDE